MTGFYVVLFSSSEQTQGLCMCDLSAVCHSNFIMSLLALQCS